LGCEEGFGFGQAQFEFGFDVFAVLVAVEEEEGEAGLFDQSGFAVLSCGGGLLRPELGAAVRELLSYPAACIMTC
jgi:hypothetical protein